MTQPIPRSAHGPIDYLYVVALAAAPFVAGFSGVLSASVTAWAFAAVVLAVTLFTRFEAGVWKVVPYRLHLLADIGGSLFMLAAPWILGFSESDAARSTFLGFGAFGLIAVALSRWDELGTVRAQPI